MTGHVIGSYKILDRIGEGGMGTVYRGLDLMLDRTVAVKALRPELAGNADLIARFRMEAKAVARLQHPNVAGVYALLMEAGCYYLVMEYIQGETLEARLRRDGRLHPAHAAALIVQALAGLDHAHRQGVVHRDIKPANLMLTPQGGVKIMDFGIARLLGAQRMTRTRFAVGTAEYMAPEQVQGREVDGRTDLYALGVVCYETLTGQVPFQSESEFELMRAQVECAPPRLRTRLPEAPEALEVLLDRSLAKDPDDRFPDAEAFRTALLGLDLPVPPRPAPGPTRVLETPATSTPEEETTRPWVAAVREEAPTRMIAAAEPLVPRAPVPPSAWHRRPIVWAGAALALLLVTTLLFLRSETAPPDGPLPVAAETAPEEIPDGYTASTAPSPAPPSPGLSSGGISGSLQTAALMASAERFFARDQLSSPADSNALDVAARVLAGDPTHAQARALVRRVAERYMTWGMDQQRRNRYPDAVRHYRAALQVTRRFPAAAGDLAAGVQTHLSAVAALAAQEPSAPTPATAQASPSQGQVRVVVRPFGDVFVDGKRVASGTNAPVTATLSPGRHRVRVTHPTFGSAERTVEVRSGETADVHFSLSATLGVTSTPPNARIHVNGQPTDRYTPARLTLAPGTYTLHVERGGQRSAPRQVVVRAGEESRVAFTLDSD